MKKPTILLRSIAIALVLVALSAAFAQTDGPILERSVRAHMVFLAGDALQGRGSGTQFERIAAEYVGSMMAQFGVEPAGDGGASFVQTVRFVRNSFADNPKLTFGEASLEHGNQMIVLRMNAPSVSGPLEKFSPDKKPPTGAIVFVSNNGEPVTNQAMGAILASGAAAVIVEETAQWRANWSRFASRKVSWTVLGAREEPQSAMIVVSKDESAKLAAAPDGTRIEIKGTPAPAQEQRTWNAVGKIVGSDPKLASEVILLSAHLDHLGVRENAPGGDKIFNGADDDASGCVAVLELARVLAAGAKPKRTVFFAFYGSEEAGGFGSRFFVQNLPFPKEKFVANLQFEMIGRPDAKVKNDELWLTGFERSNLGPELAKQGAKLVADPHPEENFFQRSDNFTLAREGIVAHTVSSFGLHRDYHQSSDELSTIDFTHMTRSINSMVKPVVWLANSEFKPAWNEGGRP